MKKYFSNIFALAALLMAGAAFTACSSDDNSIEQPANPVGEKTYTLTINASKGANASTRALKLETSGALTAYWENGDELSVLNYTQMADLSGVLTAKNTNGATATFSGTLTGTIAVGDVLHLFYHQPTGIGDFLAQTGTLESAAARDEAVAIVTVASVEGGEITISETSASFLTQTPMLKLTLTDGTNKLNATQLKVSATMTVASLPMTEDIATFTLPEATYTTNGDGILYFALPSKTNVAAALVDKIKAKVPSIAPMVTIDAVKTALDGATLTYTATVGSDTYTATKDNGYTFAAGKYYAGTLTMEQAYAANEYNMASWNSTQEKVVFTKQAAMSATAVANSDAAVTWSAGWYTVSGNVTINGKVTLGANTYLILQDGATLTINGQLDCKTNSKSLYIFGQKKGDGKLNVTNNSGNAINSKAGYRIDIHGGEVTAEATGTGLFTGYLAVYGGKLTATSGGGNGIGFGNTIDVYGGEVVATSNATSGACYGIRSSGSNTNQILTVYGDKVTATGNGVSDMAGYGSGFGCYVKSGTSGIKFYFSDNGTDWDAGTNYSSATEVGGLNGAAATKKRYAKAE